MWIPPGFTGEWLRNPLLGLRYCMWIHFSQPPAVLLLSKFSPGCQPFILSSSMCAKCRSWNKTDPLFQVTKMKSVKHSKPLAVSDSFSGRMKEAWIRCFSLLVLPGNCIEVTGPNRWPVSWIKSSDRKNWPWQCIAWRVTVGEVQKQHAELYVWRPSPVHFLKQSVQINMDPNSKS